MFKRHNRFRHFLSVWYNRLKRYRVWLFSKQRYSKSYSPEKLTHLIKKHESVLLKQLGESEMYLQHNKVNNLKIAVKQLNKIIIKPGEAFSFCRLVGLPSRAKGYLVGMELRSGKASKGFGGGLCQISNLIHWVVLHSPLTIIEHHHHSFDPFPDNGRKQPFGSGATVFYNYLDYQFINNTEITFQLRLEVGPTHLQGELRADAPLEYQYKIIEKNHKFYKNGKDFYRQNEIWRQIKDIHKHETEVKEELIQKNDSLVLYIPQGFEYID